MSTVKEYYRLTKPGIIYGNLLTAIGGFLFGSYGHIDPWLLLAAAAGTACVIASACVFNNYIDRDIDAIMRRTQKRAMVTHTIPSINALAYGTVLGLAGFVLLAVFTNMPTFVLGAIGFVSYVFLYTPSKRRTVHSTLIGSISGSTPIAAGYTAAHGSFTVGALLLFIIMTIWQMPHFYAIAIFRQGDYAAAKVPVLSVAKDVLATKKQILWYMVAFVVAVAALPLLGYASFCFFVVMVGYSLYWLWQGWQGLRLKVDDAKWARSIFGTSLMMLLVLSFMLSIDNWLP